MKKVVLLFFAVLTAFAAFGFAPAAAKTEPELVSSCKSAYLCDWRSGTAVYGKEELKHLPIASMCKIMTLVLCFDEIENAGLPRTRRSPSAKRRAVWAVRRYFWKRRRISCEGTHQEHLHCIRKRFLCGDGGAHCGERGSLRQKNERTRQIAANE